MFEEYPLLNIGFHLFGLTLIFCYIAIITMNSACPKAFTKLVAKPGIKTILNNDNYNKSGQILIVFGFTGGCLLYGVIFDALIRYPLYESFDIYIDVLQPYIWGAVFFSGISIFTSWLKNKLKDPIDLYNYYRDTEQK